LRLPLLLVGLLSAQTLRAQELDSIIILDLFERFEWRNLYRNGGTVVYLNDTDSVLLQAHRRSQRFRFSGFYAFVMGEHTMRIEGLRIVKPKDETVALRLRSVKTRRETTFVSDTVLTIGPHLTAPHIYWHLLGRADRFQNRQWQLLLTSHPFTLRNYVNRRIPMRDVKRSIKHQYAYENGQYIRTEVYPLPEHLQPMRTWQKVAYLGFGALVVAAALGVL
jgi:hypothetical protein